ncbi:MAG: glycosyltransferase [Lachnospiraceae bacterium]|nr:glycosyltransferase [Lachnospiraceae bacterium]
MNILVYKWDIFPYNDIINELKEQGHSTDVLAFPIKNHIQDTSFEHKLAEYLENGSYNAVFSVNYFTVISNTCHKYGIPYISWTCDAPLAGMRNPSIHNPENTIYVFDYKEYEYFKNKGVDTVKYLPLAGAPERITNLLAENHTSRDNRKYSYDISFVGNLYDKNLYDEMAGVLPPYLCGYMDATIEAQLNVSGGNIINIMLTDDIMENASKYMDLKQGGKNLEELKLYFATSVLSYKAAAVLRRQVLNALSHVAGMHLFTTSSTDGLFKTIVHPPVKYHSEMPLVFATSKINLNITTPNIENGIPLRVFDVLSAGGFLMTDYRPGLEKLFDIGKDLVVYDGINDLTSKAQYYLNHDKERELISASGFDKLQKLHTYKHRIHVMFSL